MLRTLSTFAALSMAGTVILSLLPEGGIKRTAGMVMGLITILCWAEGIGALLGLSFPALNGNTGLVFTSFNVDSAADAVAQALAERWDPAP